LIQEKSKLNREEFLLAFSPERIDPANLTWNIKNTPKLVAGMNGAAATKAAEFYSKFINEVIMCDSLEIAETAKLLENSFRLLNIAFINELSNFCSRQGVDILKVIAAASTKPYGFMSFYPSLGAGGHCIPVDPVYLTTRASEVDASMKLLELAQEVNSDTPANYIRRLEAKVGKVENKKILVIGIGYKANVADVRESPVLTLIHVLRAKKAIVEWHDELVQDWNGENSVDLSGDFDFAILATPHNNVDLRKLNGIEIYDSRNSLL
jgi:UDP-N-acetyl-D-glucosamine dehydrogenase